MSTVSRIAAALIGPALIGAAALLVGTAATAAAVPSGPDPIDKQQHLSIPVLAVTDIGDLVKVANLGHDLAGLLGQ
ncbi:hypothetical protein ACFC1R_29890 [Kitasatospora sp. NPDC056138]|uniref:hypothetical protein n=1 Tax=Kitasatospora sp. NPDC056138 TaxID=3345724 RepID=UPI0035DD50F4